MRRTSLVRASLCFLCASALAIGLPATVAPRLFYNDFPFVAGWVHLLPPYNQHLVTDVGGLYLGFSVVLGWAAWSLDPALVRAVSAGWLLTGVLHLAFHATHLEHFGTGDALGELASLALIVLPAGLALWGALPAANAAPR
ncbi:MAG TPA: hypothetical protein VFJ61_04830 [Solirubrobacterales bacterium]|nr:hypothetical protein [Solirubrobacterales bacterium]